MLAGQIRTAVEQLRTKLQEVAAFTAMQRELDDAVARVAQLRAKLATLGPIEEPQPTRVAQAKRTTAVTTKAPPVTAAPAASAVNGKDIRYSTAVRDWARARGMQIATNGRIADSIIDAYLAAHR